MIPDATTTSPAGHRTIGVAVPVPEPWGERLREHRASFGDPLAASIPTHVTLLPPTPVADEARRRRRAAPRAGGEHHAPLRHPPARHRDVPAGVAGGVRAGSSRASASASLLERAVRRGPLERDLAFYYHPHVTVAHHLPDDALDTAFEALAGFECRFTVDAFHLYEHGDDGVWRTDRAFGFGARAESAAVDGVR
ncbi:phosphoesterase [Angustibacter aerolatus]|uniref:Phosphoesterase n=1 Tax=Angustibacter aerolatus TaxID=1162965 RepID=A0ABQ6JNH8_9ACTN|nr:2'-5' RNA ligase family protein [Angustibacter aerolatus]GMA88236.1 phosphoesterase [Angustibacter aerolatus]